MQPGQALKPTLDTNYRYIAGYMPAPSKPVEMIDVMKCVACGHSEDK